MKKILMVLIALPMIFAANARAEMMFMENALLGNSAPEFTLPKTSGESQSLKDFREGKNTIVFFWATWCPHCREELKSMNKRFDELTQKGIKIAAVDLGENAEIVKSFTKNSEVKPTIFIDEQSSLEEKYQLIGLPTLFFLDKEGVIKAVKHSLPADIEKMFATNSVPTK